jgi:hypothetical protein
LLRQEAVMSTDEIRRQALVRDIARRLMISAIDEIEVIDAQLVALERARDVEPVAEERVAYVPDDFSGAG